MKKQLAYLFSGHQQLVRKKQLALFIQWLYLYICLLFNADLKDSEGKQHPQFVFLHSSRLEQIGPLP